MHHEYHHWHSPALGGTHMRIHVWGHAGARLLVFPTSMGDHREWPDRRMTSVLRDHLERGWLQMWSVDTVNDSSWYAKWKSPHDRALRQLAYDAYVRDEVLPLMDHRNPNRYTIAAGASFGAYHAMVFGLRNPHRVQRIVAMSGPYDMSGWFGGQHSWATHAVNPAAFMRHEHDPARLDAFRRQDIIMAIGRDDPFVQDNRDFSGVLWGKGIGNALREWDGHAHDWPWWERMIRLYVGGHD